MKFLEKRLGCVFLGHKWKFQQPDRNVSSPDWSNAKFSCVCVHCGVMDFRERPKEAK